VRTVLGALAVYATLPLLAVVWSGAGLVKLVRRRPWLWALVPALPLLLCGYWFLFSNGTATTAVTLQVHPGMNFSAFASQLESQGITGHGRLLRWAARLTGADSKLHVGLYEVSPQDSPLEILLKILRHEQVYLQFTLVEGCTLKDCLPQVALAVGLPVDSLWRCVRPPVWRTQHAGTREPAEGYLFPDTYRVPWGAPAATLIALMTDQFEAVWKDESAGYSGPLSRHEAITLASLIEAEARDGDERGLISSVFHNRLRKRMRLQCDPTVIYAMGGLDRPLLRKDWDFESPYNTYLVAGLPPGPICSPGRAALRAALHPDSTDYLYFMARGDGTHQFSRTLREHESAYRQVKVGAAPRH
jgi:UPF0755 protein